MFLSQIQVPDKEKLAGFPRTQMNRKVKKQTLLIIMSVNGINVFRRAPFELHDSLEPSLKVIPCILAKQAEHILRHCLIRFRGF